MSSLSAALEREIRGGKFKAGDRLPTESDMSRTTGVSRTVVREAVASLRAAGMVETRRGAGAFVTATTEWQRVQPAMLRSTLDDIVAVLELRLAMEVEAASLAAIRHDSADLRELEAILYSAGDTPEWRMQVSIDLRFHKAISAATKNKYFTDFMEFLGDFAFPRRHFGDSTARLYHTQDHGRQIESEHRAIFEAIKSRDGALASAQMRSHLAGSRARYQEMLKTAEAMPGAPPKGRGGD